VSDAATWDDGGRAPDRHVCARCQRDAEVLFVLRNIERLLSKGGAT
jgi:hypothetical protein